MPVFLRFAVCLALLAFAAGTVRAEPFRPQDPATVLEKLPFKPGDPQLRELRELRMTLATNPNDLGAAKRLARRYYEMVGAEGDPRYVGYAQAALSPWWSLPEPPVDVLVLRASLEQYRHDFAAALADLKAAVARDPGNAEAWSLSATIHMVQGHYPEARSDCTSLRKLTSELIGIGCSAMLDALVGKARSAHSELQAALDRTADATPAQRLWVLTRLGEMAARYGDYAMAEAHFNNALSLGVTDGYLLAAYADLLLDQKRPGEVLTLLKGMNRSDLLLLRIALAEKALALPEPLKSRTELASRFEAAAMRGDKVHQVEEARFRLHVLGETQKALALAEENWTVQKETRDARILLETAVATKNAAAAAPVLDWLRETKMEDVTLLRLARQLQGP
jgi:tetratricopeptide (TPR) repeat protein